MQTKNTKDFKLILEFQFIKNALGLQEKDHIVCENDGKILKLVVSEDTTEQTCPKCGSKTTRIHDYRTQTIKTINVVNKQTLPVLKKRRYVCPCCGKRFYEHYDAAAVKLFYIGYTPKFDIEPKKDI